MCCKWSKLAQQLMKWWPNTHNFPCVWSVQVMCEGDRFDRLIRRAFQTCDELAFKVGGVQVFMKRCQICMHKALRKTLFFTSYEAVLSMLVF